MSQTDVLLELLRSAVLDRQPVIQKDVVVDWDGLMDQATSQNVLAWIWDGICKLPESQKPPRRYAISWGLTAQEAWNDYARQLDVLNRIVDACDKQNIRVLLLKGLGLSSLFPNPKSRSSGDIDIYLFDDYEKGNHLFPEVEVKAAGKHSLIHVNGVLIENHSNFLEPNTPQKRKILDKIHASLSDVVLTPYGYYVLEPLSNCLFLAFHTSKHFLQKTILPIRNIIDFAMFMKSKNGQEKLAPKECRELMKEMGMEKCFAMLIFLSEEILGINLSQYHFYTLPQKDMDMMREILMDDSILEQMPLRKKRRYLRCVKRYIPRNLSIKQEMRGSVSRIVKRVLHVPEKESLRKKMSK